MPLQWFFFFWSHAISMVPRVAIDMLRSLVPVMALPHVQAKLVEAQ